MSSDQSNVPAQPGSASPPVPAGPLQPPANVPRPDPLRSRLAPATLIVIVLVLWAILMPRANPNERLATRVTAAIVNNDMHPVEAVFVPANKAKLEDRMLVGRLSQDLNELGKLKRIKEDTPQNSAAGYHHFQAEFSKGTWEEDMTTGSDGKIVTFHVHAPSANFSR
jgi:hypothetical protein